MSGGVTRIMDRTRKASLAGSEGLPIQDGSGVGSGKYTLISDILDWIKTQLGWASGTTFVPTVANVANLATATVNQFTYQRSGNVVSFAGEIDLTTTALVTTQFTLTLPIASLFTGNQDAAGVLSTGAGTSGFIRCDGVSKLYFQFVSASTGAQGLRFTGQYTVR